jgi:hypothetical protein
MIFCCFTSSTGQRFQGVDSSLDELIEAGILAAQTTLDESNSLPMSKEAIAELTLRSLRQVCVHRDMYCYSYANSFRDYLDKSNGECIRVAHCIEYGYFT